MSSVGRSVGEFGEACDSMASQATLRAVARAEHADCLLCSATHPFGVKLAFEVQSDGSVLASFRCPPELQGYQDMLHGGVISALLDAAMTNVLFSRGIVAVTAELTVRFLLPVRTDRVGRVRAFVQKVASEALYYVNAELEQDEQLAARATGKFLVKSGV